MVKQKQRKELKTTKSRKRVRYACKSGLQYLIDISNTLPADLQLKNVPELTEKRFTLAQPGSPEWIEIYKNQEDAFRAYLKTLPKEFQEFIHWATKKLFEEFNAWVQKLPSAPDNPEVKTQYWIRRVEVHKRVVDIYEKIKWIRENLYKLAKIGENVEAYVGKQLDVALGVLFVEYAYLDEHGKIRRQPDKFTEIMEGVEISRLRTCLVCQKLFWANRKDKKCCSEMHSAVIRQRQSRKIKEERGQIYSKFSKLRKQRQKNEISTSEDDQIRKENER
ncbi:MAG TPA: hypothetical protein VF717_15105 [Pyrinomonadaceae bacterium]|jgi:hypothetical protein